MHELSIIHSILEAVEAELHQHGGQRKVEAIDLEIGALAGVEINTLEFLWPAAVEQTVLDSARLNIVQIPGLARCSDCTSTFELAHYFDPCPKCGSHLLEIQQGEDLRIRSLTLVEKPWSDELPLPPINPN
ncbi:MAG: hydrogenase maturation nickel metallochaperone HypA [Bacteroidetes bacterium]|nr:MAG: hydrogenase maturation nickel metallochaperone HypA [Bacteroidota bacterium]